MRQSEDRVIIWTGRRGPSRWIVAIIFPLAAGGAMAQQRIDLPLRPGLTQPVYATLAAKSLANLVLFPGGDGVYMAR